MPPRRQTRHHYVVEVRRLIKGWSWWKGAWNPRWRVAALCLGGNPMTCKRRYLLLVVPMVGISGTIQPFLLSCTTFNPLIVRKLAERKDCSSSGLSKFNEECIWSSESYHFQWWSPSMNSMQLLVAWMLELDSKRCWIRWFWCSKRIWERFWIIELRILNFGAAKSEQILRCWTREGKQLQWLFQW